MLTQAVVLTGEEFQKWFAFFPELKTVLLKNEESRILIIFDPKSKIMRFLECDRKETILKLVIEIQGGLAASTTNLLLKIISNHISHMLFSTGFCEEEVACYWEGFFVGSALKEDSPDHLIEDLSRVATISKHEIIRVTET